MTCSNSQPALKELAVRVQGGWNGKKEGGGEMREIMHEKRCALHMAQIHIMMMQVVASLGPRLGHLVLL